jgi:hypothetical protein
MPGENSSDASVRSAKVTVTRDSPDDVQMRQVTVYFDHEHKGELLFGDSITLSAKPGIHLLRVDNTWNHKDLELDLKAGDDLHFLTKSTAGQLSKFLLTAFGAGPIYVSIEPVVVRHSGC